jgi:hypothetical protein
MPIQPNQRPLKPGTQLVFIAEGKGMSAKNGAIAEVTKDNVSGFIQIHWHDTPERNGQMDGGYLPSDFDLMPVITAMSNTSIAPSPTFNGGATVFTAPVPMEKFSFLEKGTRVRIANKLSGLNADIGCEGLLSYDYSFSDGYCDVDWLPCTPNGPQLHGTINGGYYPSQFEVIASPHSFQLKVIQSTFNWSIGSVSPGIKISNTCMPGNTSCSDCSEDCNEKEVVPVALDSTPKNNDGRTTCFWCSAPTKKYYGLIAVGDVCTKCGK